MPVVKRGDAEICTRYRPQRLSEVVGNQTIVNALKNAINAGESRQKAYMFAGNSGCGKTTIARIMAMGLNCEKGETSEPCLECQSCKDILSNRAYNVKELNIARLNKKEDAEGFVDDMSEVSLFGSKKIYIFDEAHQLTSHAQNLLLKHIEEPPPNTYIFIATTEVKKIVQTIRNRCEPHIFMPPKTDEVIQLLKEVIAQEPDWKDKLSDSDKKRFLEVMKGEPFRAVLKMIDAVIRGGVKVLDNYYGAELPDEYAKIPALIMKAQFEEIAQDLSKLNGETEGGVNCEGIRQGILVYFSSVLKNSKFGIQGAHAADVIEQFTQPYFEGNQKANFAKLLKDLFKACIFYKG